MTANSSGRSAPWTTADDRVRPVFFDQRLSGRSAGSADSEMVGFRLATCLAEGKRPPPIQKAMSRPDLATAMVYAHLS